MSTKDWDSILRDHPDLKDDGSRDELNVVMLQQNAHRLAGLLPSLLPGLPEQSSAPQPTMLTREGTSFLKKGLSSRDDSKAVVEPVPGGGKPT